MTCETCGGLKYQRTPYQGSDPIAIDIFRPCPECNPDETAPYCAQNHLSDHWASKAKSQAMSLWLESLKKIADELPEKEQDRLDRYIGIACRHCENGGVDSTLVRNLELLTGSKFTFRVRQKP